MAETKKQTGNSNTEKVAVVRIRNVVKASNVAIDTLNMLRLKRKYTCSVFPKTPAIFGMIEKVKDYTTYGEIDSETIAILTEKRGKKDKEGKLKPYFNLHPPIGGFERKGIKHSFSQGGALGHRGAKINDLIKRMV